METKKLKLWKRRFELIRIGNMRFERCEDRWIGFMNIKGKKYPYSLNPMKDSHLIRFEIAIEQLVCF